MSRRIVAGTLLVGIEGELDHCHGSWEMLNAAILLPLAHPSPVRCVVVDLTYCRFLDGMALSVFLDALDRLPEDGSLVFVKPSPNIRRLFQLTGLDSWSRVQIIDACDAGTMFFGPETACTIPSSLAS